MSVLRALEGLAFGFLALDLYVGKKPNVPMSVGFA